MSRKKLNQGRPFLLGTNDNPPPLRVPWQMWSKSSDPYQQGLVAFEFTEEGLAVGWFPEGFLSKDVIPWHELAWMAGNDHPDLKDEVQRIKENAELEGFKHARDRVLDVVQSVIAEEPDNPFLKKYVDKLKKAIDGAKGAFG